MALFKAKKKNVDEYETEASLPDFYIDTNGYVMFENATLGGADILEVIPHVPTEGWTHQDPVFHDTSTDDDNYTPSTDRTWDDYRNVIVPGWVAFLNGLQETSGGDNAIHLQILAKKCRCDEWETRWDYAGVEARKEFGGLISDVRSGYVRNTRDKWIAARASEYIDLIDGWRNSVNRLSGNVFDVRKLPAYKTKFFIIISYTPSSEGWWLDGRDTDYYVRDNNSAMALFRDDKAVDRVTSFLTHKQRKKQEREEGGTIGDFFWIESDRTAQILYTRERKIMKIIDDWNRKNKNCSMPFHLRKVDEREAAALIRFFPNILTPYWDKIWNLQVDTNDVLYRQKVRKALDLGDASFLDAENTKSLMESVAEDNVDLSHGDSQKESFLDRYKGKSFDEIGDVSNEYDDLSWTPEREEQRAEHISEMEVRKQANVDLWGDLDTSLVLDDEYKTAAQRREDFIKKYRQMPDPDSMAGITRKHDEVISGSSNNKNGLASKRGANSRHGDDHSNEKR